jgi:ketosteroid isomerase-like protein
MKKQTSFPLNCIMNRSAVKRLFSRIGYMPVIILLMVSWSTTVPITAHAAYSGTESDLQEMNLTTEDRVAIEALASSYSKFALAGDFESWVQLYMEDAVRMNPGMPPLEGRDAISQWINSMDITVTTSKITVIEVEGTRELAYVRGNFQSELSINLGTEELIISDEGSWLAVVRRDGQDNWRFYRFITNTDLAP